MIARGTGLEITRGDLDEAMTGIKYAYQKQGQTMSPAQAINIERQVLHNLIDPKLLLAKATDADKEAGKPAADLHMTALRENLGSPEALNQPLKAAGETADEECSKFADRPPRRGDAARIESRRDG